MSNLWNVETFRFRNRGRAVCAQPGCNRLPALVTRLRARQHASQTGHTVRFVVEDITTYMPPNAKATRREP